MPKVFISYRREDSAAFAGRLFDRLKEHFGDDNVFRDIDAIRWGDKFADEIDRRVADCDAFVAVIGRQWLTIASEGGKRRLDERDDFVKAELSAALKQHKLVIPALIDGASVPDRSKLPSEIRALVDRHAAELSDSRFHYDVQRLIDTIDRAVDDSVDATGWPPLAWLRRVWRRLKRPWAPRTLALICSGAVAVALAGWAVLPFEHPWDTPAAADVEPGLAQTRGELELRLREVVSALAKTAPSDDALRSMLSKEMQRLQAKLLDVESTHTARRAVLQQLDSVLAGLQGAVPAASIDTARRALADNDTRPAAALLGQVAEGADAARAAQAAFQLGELAYDRVDYQQAQLHYAKAARLRPDDPRLLNMAGRIAHELGRNAEAGGLLTRALEIRRRSLPADHPELAESLNNLALLHKDSGDFAEAEQLYNEALQAQRDSPRPDAASHALVAGNLARLYRSAGPKTAAIDAEVEKLLREALDAVQQAPGSAQADLATALNNLAGFYWSSGRLGEAEPLYAQALALREKSLPANHPAIAESLNNLAVTFDAQGEHDRAESNYLRVLEIQTRAFGAKSPKRATALNNLAELYRKQRLYAKAEDRYAEALALLDGPGGSPAAAALARHNLALAYFDQAQYAKAEPLFRQAVAALQDTLPADDPQLATVMRSYADGLQKLERNADAAAWRSKADASLAAAARQAASAAPAARAAP